MCTTFINTFLAEESKQESFPSYICVGAGQDEKGTCFGDSGGPIIVEKDDSWTLAGVVSGEVPGLERNC